MVDSIPITPGSGRNVAVNAGQTMPDSTLADVQFVEMFGVTSQTAWADLSITTGSAYASGQCVGGLITFANASLYAGGGGLVRNVIAIDESAVNPQGSLMLFSSAPTTPTDHTAWSPTLSDLKHACGQFVFFNNWITYGSMAFLSDVNNDWNIDALPYTTSGTTLYGIFVANRAFTFSVANGFHISLLLQRT